MMKVSNLMVLGLVIVNGDECRKGRKVIYKESFEYSAISCRGHSASIVELGMERHSTLMLFKERLITSASMLLLASQDINSWPVVDPLPSYGHGRDAAGGGTSVLFLEQISLMLLSQVNALRHYSDNALRHYSDIQSNTCEFSLLKCPSCIQQQNNHTIQGITILAPVTSPNTDGINPDSCTDTGIEDNYIVSADDCIAVKSGWDEYGIHYGMPTKHLIIRRLTCISPYNAAIALGSEMSGGIQDVRAQDITAINTESGVRIKTGVGRGGYVKDIYVKGMTLHTMKWVFWMTGNYGSHADNHYDPNAFPEVKGINYRDVVAENVSMAGRLEGISGDPFTGICISNATIGKAKKAKKYPWTCTDVEGITNGVVPPPCDLLPNQVDAKIGMCEFPQDTLDNDNLELRACSYSMT